MMLVNLTLLIDLLVLMISMLKGSKEQIGKYILAWMSGSVTSVPFSHHHHSFSDHFVLLSSGNEVGLGAGGEFAGILAGVLSCLAVCALRCSGTHYGLLLKDFGATCLLIIPLDSHDLSFFVWLFVFYTVLAIIIVCHFLFVKIISNTNSLCVGLGR